MSSPRPPPVVWQFLVICTSITICALGATPMFTDCSNVNSNFTTSSGGDFEAIGCSYPSKETNVSLGFGTGSTATVYIAYGKVAAGTSASLWVQCPADAISKSLIITVTGISFGQDASFRFTGALPARSSLHISNNTFYLSQQNKNTFINTGIPFTTAILIGAWGTALVLEEGTTMSADNNSVACRWVASDNTEIVAIAVVGASATLRSLSTLSLSGNSIVNSSFSSSSGSSYSFAAYLYLSSSSGSSLILAQQSAIAMSGNSIINSSYSGSSYLYVARLYLSSSSGSSSLLLAQQSAIAMSGNSIINSSFSGYGYSKSAYLHLSSSSGNSNSLALYNQSAITMNSNSIINSGSSDPGYSYVAYVYLFSSSGSIITLYNQSAIAMSGNSIINSSSSNAYVSYVAHLWLNNPSSSSSLTLHNQSAITMSGNSIINSSSSSSFVAYLWLSSPSGNSSLTLYNQSVIAMSGNSVINSNSSGSSSYSYVAYLYLSSSSGSLTLYNQSAIAMSGNSIVNSSFSINVYVAYVYLSSFSGSLTLYNQSAITMSGNSIINSRFRDDAHVAHVHLSSSSGGSSLTLADQSSFTLSGNGIINSSGGGLAFVAFLYIYSPSGSSLTLYKISSIAMSGNSIISCSANGNYAYIAHLQICSVSSSSNSLTLYNQAAIAMKSNSIINSSFSGFAYVAYLQLYSPSSSLTFYIISLTLYHQSAIALSGNSIINSNFSSNTWVAHLDLFSSSGSSNLTLHNHSSLTMSGNSIIGSRFSGNYAYVAYLLPSSSSSSGNTSITLYNQSAIAMNGNSMIDSSFSGSAYVAFLYFYISSSSLALHNQSTIGMSGNSIINFSVSGNAYAAFLYFSSSSSSLKLYNQSAIAMNGNSIIHSSFRGTYSYAAYLALSSSSGSTSATLYNQSAITMSGNSITNSSFIGNAYVAFLYLYISSSNLTLYNQSAIAMNSNSIINSSFRGTYSYAAYLALSSSSGSTSLTIYNQSAIAMSGNSITNSSFIGNAHVAFLYLNSPSSSLTLYNQSAIAMSGNSHSQVRASLVVIEVFGHILLTGMASIIMERNSAYAIYGLFAVLQMSARYITVNDSSSISTTGNRLQVPAGQGAQLASLLTISSLSGNSASSVLSISRGSSLAVASNDIIAGAMALNVTMKVSAEFPSTIAIVDNHVSEGYASWLANFTGAFRLNGTFLATGNTVEAQNRMANFSFAAIASGFTNGSMASVQACGNYLSWVGPILAPKLYLQPTPFASLAAKCLPPTLTLLASRSVSSAFSVSPSPTMPMSDSSSHDPLASNSTTESPSRNGSSETFTRSLSKSISLVSDSRPPPTTEQQCLSMTVEPTIRLANCSIGDICKVVKVASDQLALFDTCTEPGPTETVAKDSAFVPLAKYIGNAAKQAEIHSSYTGTALPSGSFYYGSVVVLWPEGMANVTHVGPASPAIAACWVHVRSANASEIGVAVEALTVAADSALDSASAPVVLMALSLNVSCGAAAVVFNRTIAMERPVVYLPTKAFVPGKAVQDTATTSGALSVTVGAVAVPIAAMQQGVALALLRMAQCEEDALNGEPLDLSVHPLQFGLGGGSGKYGRGALVGNLLVVPAIWCALMYLLVPLAIRALTGRTLDASRDFVGWPGMALMPLAVLSEGSAMASVGLTQGSVGDIIMGLVGLAILLVATACWAAELWRMRRQVALRRASSVESWAKVIHPRLEWEVGNDGNTVAVSSYLDKRIQLVGSSWWLWSALAAHVLSMVVGIAEGLPVSSGMCRVRWAVASFAAVLQAAAVMTNTVPVELLLLGVIGAMSCILVVLIALSTFDVVSPGSTFSALNAVGTVNSILGIALIGIGACTGAYEIFTQRSRRALSARRYTQLPATPLSLLSVPMLPQQQAEVSLNPLPVVTSPPTSEELAIEVPARRRSSRYQEMPAHWASILEDADRAASERELGKRSALVMSLGRHP